MTFEEWLATYESSPFSIDNMKAAWEAGHNEGFKEYKDKLENDDYLIMPTEATEEMLEKGLIYCGNRHSLDQAYSAMIAAYLEETT